MNHKRTLQEFREDNFLEHVKEVPNLEVGGMTSYEQDEILGELLGNQLRRRAMSRYAPKPHWALCL